MRNVTANRVQDLPWEQGLPGGQGRLLLSQTM